MSRGVGSKSRRPKRPARSALPIVDRIRAARPRKVTGRSERIIDRSGRWGRMDAWKFGDPDPKHASWCHLQPPAPIGECSCWRSLPARTVRRLLEEAS